MHKNHIQYKPVKERILPTVLILLAIVGIGHISSVATRTRCENSSAKRIATGFMKNEKFYLRWGDEDSSRIFMRVGANVTQYITLPGSDDFKRLTWPAGDPVPHIKEGGRTAHVSRGRLTIPFIVSVFHGTVYGNTGAETATTYYLAVFGMPIRLVKIIHEVG